MSLSCYCNEYEPSGSYDGTYWYFPPNDFTKFEAKRRKRCVSCDCLIEIGSEVLEFKREREPYTWVEERISGEEIPIASHFLCFRCGGIYLSLEDAGYCIDPYNTLDALSEYWDLTGFEPMA